MAFSAYPSNGQSNANPSGQQIYISPTTVTEPQPTHFHRVSTHSSGDAVPIEMKPMANNSNGPAQATQHGADANVNAQHQPLSTRVEDGLHDFVHRVEYELYLDPTGRSRRHSMWDRFRGKNRRKISWVESARNTLFSSGV